MSALVTYRLDGAVATVTMDDGKRNVLSLAMLAELKAALDQATTDKAVLVLSGREGVFSAGFDLPVLMAGGEPAADMLAGGFALAQRLLSFPTPVVIACTGHAVAMGLFVVMSGDLRVGAAGPFKIMANEVALGLTLPRAAVEICRDRQSTAYLNRTLLLAEQFAPESAIDAGILDLVVPAAELHTVVAERAAVYAKLNMHAHAATKQRARGVFHQTLSAAFALDDRDFRAGTHLKA
jgi:enoyl-CoA hydratase